MPALPTPDDAPAFMIDLDAFRATPLARAPYDHVIVPHFVPASVFESAVRDYPDIAERGSFALDHLRYGPAFEALLNALQSPEFQASVAEKFQVDLTGRPTMITVRGKCGSKDGSVHTDTESKILSLLLYMNQSWDDNIGGRLRILNSASLDDVATEIPPDRGTLLVFRRSDHSFHGHKPFTGTRRVIQLNWVTEQKFADRHQARHRLSAWVKRWRFFSGSRTA